MLTQEQKLFLRFSCKAIGLALVAFAVVALLALASRNSDSYARSLAKKESLLGATAAPRLIVMGGSGSAIGFDSKLFKEKTGVNVVNTGVFAGFGLRFIERVIVPHVGKGDIVLILPEYELLHQPPGGDGHILLETVLENPSHVVDILNPHTVVAMTRALPGWFRGRLESIAHKISGKQSSSVYSLKNVNAFGDIDSPLLDESIISPEDMAKATESFIRPQADSGSLETLVRMTASMKEKGVKVFISWAPLLESAPTSTMQAAQSREAELRKAFPSSTFVGSQKDFMYPAGLFYDAPTHLNDAGRTQRTQKIIKLMPIRP
ncbi:MAG TPA: hypothetical protein VGE35_03395 [Candidatus Paceibacterota bacterium]